MLILGAGPTGLAAGLSLARQGCAVELVEAEEDPGGLCRTLSWDDLRFDIGGHRFSTRYPDVERLVREVAGDDLEPVRGGSRIHTRGGFLEMPPGPASLGHLGLAAGATTGLHALVNAVVGVDPSPPPHLEAYFRHHFGDALYRRVFADYTRKAWGLDAREMAAEWGAARVGQLSLGRLLRQGLEQGGRGPLDGETFLYPKHGYGGIFRKMARGIEQAGGRVHLGCPVTKIDAPEAGPVRVEARGGERCWEAPRVLATLPLPRLLSLLRPALSDPAASAARDLPYRALILAVLDVEGQEPISPDLWLYFPDPEVPFCRLHEPANWSRALAVPEHRAVVVEYLCASSDSTWNQDDEALLSHTTQVLDDLGLLSRGRVRQGRVLRFADAYPVYSRSYRQALDGVDALLDRREGLFRAGRSGAFLYLSSDESLRQGLWVASRLAIGPPPSHHALQLDQETILLDHPHLQSTPEQVARLARTLVREAADVCTGTFAPDSPRACLTRHDQLRSDPRRPWAAHSLVSRRAWLAHGGEDVAPDDPWAPVILERILRDPERVAVRDPQVTVPATPAFWEALPRDHTRWRTLGVAPPGLRRWLVTLAAWFLLAWLYHAVLMPVPGLHGWLPPCVALLVLLLGSSRDLRVLLRAPGTGPRLRPLLGRWLRNR